MSEDKAATIFCFKPQRVTLAELERLRAEDAVGASAALPAPPSCPTTATPLPTLECSAPKIPEGPCPVCPRLAAEFEPFRQAAFYKSMHQKAVERERLHEAKREPRPGSWERLPKVSCFPPMQSDRSPLWDDLRVLLALHRTRSFLAAGRALGVSTSTAAPN